MKKSVSLSVPLALSDNLEPPTISISAASSFSPSFMRPRISSRVGLLVFAAKKTISLLGARPVATAPSLGPLSFFFLDNLNIRWNVSGFALVVGVKYETLPSAFVRPLYSGGLSCAFSTGSDVAIRRGGNSSRKDRRCSFFPASCSLVEELIPANAVAHSSVD